MSRLESIARFGVVAALGVAAALVLCFTLLPVLLVRLPAERLRNARIERSWRSALVGIEEFAVRRSGWVLALTLLVGTVGAVGFARLKIDARFEDLYGRESRVVRWARFAAEHLHKPDTLELALTPPAGTPLSEPAVLARTWDVERDLERISGLGRALSIVDPLLAVDRVLHGGALDLGATDGATAERTASLFRLLRGADPGGFALFVDRASGALRITVATDKPPQDRLRVLLREVRSGLAARVPSDWAVEVTGPLQVVEVMIDEIRRTQLESFALASAIVAVLAAVTFRSPGLASLTMVPTLLPAIVTLGVMGLAGVALDVGGAMVAAVVVGISVDDALHLLVQYRRRRSAGADPDAAMRGAIRRVGRALVTTSVALAAGFSALVLAPWQSLANFGLISAVAILLALGAGLGVLPALVVIAHRRDGSLKRLDPGRTPR